MFTTHREIVEYWETRQSECGLSIDWAEAEKLCWRCAEKRRLERCHIIPRALGGDETAANLVLLCNRCHADAPNVTDPDFMWTWLRAHAANFYGTYWQQQGLREYELIYREKPFAGLEKMEDILEQAREIVGDVLSKANTHWGQGKLNPATWAWVFRQVDQKLRHRV